MANNYPAQATLQDIPVRGYLADVSTASISYSPIAFTGVIVDAYATISAALTTANGIVTVKASHQGATAVTVGTITLTQVSSYAGQTFRMVVSGSESNRSCTPGDTLLFDSDGACDTTSIGQFVAILRKT